MKAAVLYGINEALTIEDVAIPELADDEVLVKLKAASLNKRDWWIQKGQYAGLKFPIIIGSDGAGVVEATGKNVDENLKGKKAIIYFMKNWGNNERFQSQDAIMLGLPENGCLAEFVKVKADQIFSKPANLSFEETAALPVAGVTAYRALFTKGECKQGDKVLISGVGGGAGSFALQFAVAAEAEVWITSSSDEKISKAVAAGAKGGVNYRMENWDKKLSDEAGYFDVIIDSALGDGFANLAGLAARGGRIVFFGGTAGNLPPLNGRPIFWKQISILGTTGGSPSDFKNMLAFIEEKNIHPFIDAVFSLDDAEKAIRTMDSSAGKFGKVVLSIS
ncbi:MAG: zinc-binding dehydrogenase [Arachidicoccus sp.]|nr:zinc-binding dehydrogenase [Arachidicoccus sp.]